MLLGRAFPKLFSQHEVGSKYVCFQDCSFQVRKGRESTARVVVCRELNIPCSFTLEATFCGLGYGPLKHCHMNIGHMCEVKYECLCYEWSLWLFVLWAVFSLRTS
jgi:hypothetical protein